MRVIYFGTPDFAVPPLQALLDAGHDVVGCITQPDRPRGRGQHVSASPVKVLAESCAIPILQPTKLSDPAFLEAVRAWKADIGVVAAYGRLLPRALLDIPLGGLINVHASLLPRWRGAAPIHRAIIAGDDTTGVTIMRVVLALDAGPALAAEALPIGPEETSAELESRLARLGARLLISAMRDLADGPVAEAPQDETRVTYAARLTREDGRIDWTRTARELHNQIRGLHPWPLATTYFRGKRVILRQSQLETSSEVVSPGTVVAAHGDDLIVSTGLGLLRLTQLQPEAGKPQDARAFMNGHRVAVGEMLPGSIW